MTKGMKSISWPVVALVFCLAVAAYADGQRPSGVESDDGKRDVVAKVNGVQIKRADVDMMASTLEPPRTGDIGPERKVEEVRKEALDKLIMSELLYQRAKALGLAATPADIDHAMARFKRGLGGEDGFAKFLQGQGISEKDVRIQIERSISIKHLMEKEIFKGITVSENEQKKEYDKDKSIYTRPERITAVDVIFFLDPEDPVSLKKAGEVLKKIKDDPAHDPGILSPDGTFIVRELTIQKEKEPVLYEEAERLGAGGLSGVLISEGSLHIIKIKEYTPFKQYSFEESKGFVARRIRQREQQKRLQEWEVKLKKDAEIEVFSAGRDGAGIN